MGYQLMGDCRIAVVNNALKSIKNIRYLFSWAFKKPSYTSLLKLIILDNLLLLKQVR